MTKYQGILFHTDDYHIIGPFRFPIMKALLPGEVKGMKAHEKLAAQGSYEFMKLAKKIAKEKEIEPKEAMRMLREASDKDNLIYEYIEEISTLNEKMPDETAQLLAFATLAMQFRGEVKLTPEAEYIRTPDWTLEDSEQIPMSMQRDIAQFLNWEANGWPTNYEDAAATEFGAEGNEKTKTSTSTPPSSTANG